jgi:hypothetical protein
MIRLSLLILCVLLAACGGLQQPFGKDENGKVISSIMAPPWEAMVAAGPGAANDIDFETLNGPQAVVPEIPVAQAQAEPPADIPTQPKSSGVEIRAVAVVPVVGTAGRGNDELTKAMRETMTKAGWTVLTAPDKNALTILGHVALAPTSGARQTVKLNWDVQTPDGKSLGDVKQSNAVPAGSLDAGWGENADFAAEAAATGIYELINKYR